MVESAPPVQPKAGRCAPLGLRRPLASGCTVRQTEDERSGNAQREIRGPGNPRWVQLLRVRPTRCVPSSFVRSQSWKICSYAQPMLPCYGKETGWLGDWCARRLVVQQAPSILCPPGAWVTWSLGTYTRLVPGADFGLVGHGVRQSETPRLTSQCNKLSSTETIVRSVTLGTTKSVRAASRGPQAPERDASARQQADKHVCFTAQSITSCVVRDPASTRPRPASMNPHNASGPCPLGPFQATDARCFTPLCLPGSHLTIPRSRSRSPCGDHLHSHRRYAAGVAV